MEYAYLVTYLWLFFQTQNRPAYSLARDLIRRSSSAIEPYLQTVSAQSLPGIIETFINSMKNVFRWCRAVWIPQWYHRSLLVGSYFDIVILSEIMWEPYWDGYGANRSSK